MRKGIITVLIATSLLLLAFGVGGTSGMYSSYEKCRPTYKGFTSYSSLSYTSLNYRPMPYMNYNYMPSMSYSYRPMSATYYKHAHV